APGGASAAAAAPSGNSSRATGRAVRFKLMPAPRKVGTRKKPPPQGGGGEGSVGQTERRSVFLSGTERTRLPVAAAIALSTAGAATAMVGSPMPPQKPPEGISTTSTFGISAMRRRL